MRRKTEFSLNCLRIKFMTIGRVKRHGSCKQFKEQNSKTPPVLTRNTRVKTPQIPNKVIPQQFRDQLREVFREPSTEVSHKTFLFWDLILDHQHLWYQLSRDLRKGFILWIGKIPKNVSYQSQPGRCGHMHQAKCFQVSTVWRNIWHGILHNWKYIAIDDWMWMKVFKGADYFRHIKSHGRFTKSTDSTR